MFIYLVLHFVISFCSLVYIFVGTTLDNYHLIFEIHLDCGCTGTRMLIIIIQCSKYIYIVDVQAQGS
jgi:hypothetical protein